MTNSFGVDDGNGNQITTGLEQRIARSTAQRIADERGTSVWLYEVATQDSSEPGESEEIAPTSREIGLATETQIDSIRRHEVSDVTREIMSSGVLLSWAQVGELGDEAIDWMVSRLGLTKSASDSGVLLAVRS